MMPKKAGLSTQDVMISLAVITLIITAILYPYFTRARESGGLHRSCQGNLKECAVALMLYCDDYDGMLPSSALVKHSKKWNRRDFETFATKIGKPANDLQHPITWPEVLYVHMKNKDVVWCPEDSSDQTDPKAQVSYWYKTALDKAWYGAGGTRPYRRLADYAYAPYVISFYEHSCPHFLKKRLLFNECPRLKNGLMLNAAFLDLHVKTIALTNATSGDPNNCAANKDGAPMYYNFDIKTQKRLPDGVAAKYIDPSRYCDSF